MGLGLKIAYEREDQLMVEKLSTKIHGMLLRDTEVVEVYDPQDMWRPWSSWLFAAERPFSWGAGYMLEALQLAKKNKD